MVPYLNSAFGNPSSSIHAFGREAEAAVENASRQIALLIGASEREIIFTSGATESDNLAIKGVIERRGCEKAHLITSLVEHKAVIESARWLENKGCRVTWLEAQLDGSISAEAIEKAIKIDTVLVSVMHANHEVGTINPVAEIGRLCRSRGVLFHVDAAQSCGKLPIDVDLMNIDLLSISAHKMYGPKGIGALYVRGRGPRVQLTPLFHGGGQQRGLRPGTLPTHQVVGFGRAAEIAREELAEDYARINALRDHLQAELLSHLPGAEIHGSLSSRLPGNLNIGFSDVNGKELLSALDNIAVSNGSACDSGSFESSYVLRHLGVDEQIAFASLRFGIGRFSTIDEVEKVAIAVVRAVESLRRV
jgi:cysteine desulfurase